MRKRRKALSISKSVKERVWERDGGCCVFCGSPYAAPNAHFIARSQGGLGIEENILTLCQDCHMKFDQSCRRSEMREKFRDYLKDRYEGWDETKLIYSRE